MGPWLNGTVPQYAAEVMGLNVDDIVAANSPAGLAAKNATKTIPIVIATMEDPVQQGFATSLAHPGEASKASGTSRPIDMRVSVNGTIVRLGREWRKRAPSRARGEDDAQVRDRA